MNEIEWIPENIDQPPQGQQGNVEKLISDIPETYNNRKSKVEYRGSVGVAKLSIGSNRKTYLHSESFSHKKKRNQKKSQTAVTPKRLGEYVKKVSENNKINNNKFENFDHSNSNITSNESEKRKKILQLPKKEKFKNYLKTVLESVKFQILVNFLSIFVLYSDDFKILFFTINEDVIFDGITFSIMLFFTIEFVIMRIFFKHTRNWMMSLLEAISILSLLLDIEQLKIQISVNENLSDSTQITRTSRIVRLLSRSGRLIRIAKFFVNFKNHRSQSIKRKFTSKLLKIHKVDLMNINPRGQLLGRNTIPSELRITNEIRNSVEPRASAEITLIEETKVGKKLSDLTTQRVFIIVLILTILSSLFLADAWLDTDYAFFVELRILLDYILNDIPQNLISQCFYSLTKQRTNMDRINLLDLFIPTRNLSYSSSINKDLFRKYDIVNIDYREGDQFIYGSLDLSEIKKTSAITSIAKTTYICFILLIGGYLFNNDVTKLVLNPLQLMIQKVQKIKENPLNVKDQLKDVRQIKNNEISIIEESILKIATLLALGYGQAGAQIIAKNIASSGNINPMCKGKKEYAIFGFCDIRNFTDATEILEEEVMVFVNNIGRIVHSYVDIYGGTANKNIGDAFLLVWKLPNQHIAIEELNDEEKIIPGEIARNLSDLAFFSFMKIIAHLNCDPVILQYREDVLLQERIPDYKVSLGMGLHVGWAIEGAIGSEYKIDASYLSPHVNLAEKLESATKLYGKQLLMSSNFVCLCSKIVREKMREIDNVVIKGSKNPIRLYTIDCDFTKKLNDPSKIYIRKLVDLKKAKIINDFIKGNKRAKRLIEADLELDRLLKSIDFAFRDQFLIGYDLYLGGDWINASTQFDCLLKIKFDGPTKVLYNFMEEHDFVCPDEWEGFRHI